MKPVLIVTHLDDRLAGLASECLQAAGCAIASAHPDDRAALPALHEISGIVSLGGDQSASRSAAEPFLSAEVALMAAALHDGVPVLGICLGAQLLAVAAGGRVSTMDRMYAGWPALTPLPALAADPLFGSLAAGPRVLEWHEDVIDLPAGATPLATPGPGAELFRIGPAAWGSQAHLEATPEMLLDVWLADPGGIAQVQRAGNDIEEFRSTSRELLPVQMAAARPVFSAFAGLTLLADGQ